MRTLLILALGLALTEMLGSPASGQQKPFVLQSEEFQQLQSDDTLDGSHLFIVPLATSVAGVLPVGTSGSIIPWLSGASILTRTPAFSNFSQTGTFRSLHYAGPYTAQVNAYGGRVLVTSPATDNAIVGAVVQDGSNGNSFPTGVTGYGLLANNGNQAFGIFGQADCGVHGSLTGITGTCTNELNTFNFSRAPSAQLPPNESFGTKQLNPITLQLAAYGDYPSSIALEVAQGSQPYLSGIYVSPGAATSYGILVDATSTSGANIGALIKTTSVKTPLQIQTLGSLSDNISAFVVADGNGTARASVTQIGDYVGRAFRAGGITSPSVTTCTGAGTGASCSLQTGSSDGAGTVNIAAGTNASTSGGKIGVTFGNSLGNASTACLLQAATNFLINTSFVVTAQTVNGFSFNYLNGGGAGTAMTSGTNYKVNYFCIGL